jgi:hypothetical protein
MFQQCVRFPQEQFVHEETTQEEAAGCMYAMVLLQQEVVVSSCCHIKPRHNQTIYFFDNTINTNGYLAMLPNNLTPQLFVT